MNEREIAICLYIGKLRLANRKNKDCYLAKHLIIKLLFKKAVAIFT